MLMNLTLQGISVLPWLQKALLKGTGVKLKGVFSSQAKQAINYFSEIIIPPQGTICFFHGV